MPASTHRTPGRVSRAAGFTLTELIVAVAIMALVISQLLLAFSQQREVAHEQQLVVESQQDARIVMDLVLNDLRMAGFMVHETAGIASADGGNAASDALCVSDPAAIDDSVLADVSRKFTGARLSAALAGGASTLDLDPGSMDIDGDGDVDFESGMGLIVSTSDDVHCARITAIAGGTLTFAPALPGAFAATTSEGIIVPALIYEVNGTRLTRNGLVLSSQIEDIQVQFGVDADGDGVLSNAEMPLDSLVGQDLSRIKTARIHVTAIASRADPDFTGGLAAVANRDAGAADNFRRRRVTADALLRNLR